MTSPGCLPYRHIAGSGQEDVGQSDLCHLQSWPIHISSDRTPGSLPLPVTLEPQHGRYLGPRITMLKAVYRTWHWKAGWVRISVVLGH